MRLNVETPGLRGRLHEVPFAEVVQLLCAAKRTATVEFTSGFALMGILGFQDGRCIYAAGMERAGQDAFFALATVVDGEFAVYYGKKAPNGDNISGDTLYLLLEVARRTDEERRDSLPPLPAAPTIDEVAAAVDAAIAGGPPPLPHPRRRKTDRPPFASQLETTQPGRHLKQTGMFSAFFDEYSSARERLREASVPPGKMAVLSSEAPKKRSKTKTKVKALPAEKPMAQPAPPFVSVALAGDKASEAAAGESDTDIIKDGGFVSAS